MSRRHKLTKILRKRSERLASRRAYLLMLALLAIFLAVETPLVESGVGTLPMGMTATDTIDQSFSSPNFNFQGFGLVAQTYTAGTTGNLTSINLHFLVCSICSGGNLPISINTVSEGVPTSTVMGSTVLAVSTGQLIPFSLPITFPMAIPQTAGIQYAIVIDFSALGGTNVTGEFNDNGYAAGGLFSSFDGGQTWSSNAGSDISFQTNVAPPPTCVTPPTGLISWWAGDGNANDIHGDNDGTLENGATFTPGLVGQAFNLDGYDDLIFVPHNSNLAFGSDQDFTIDAWINLQSPTPGNDDVIVGKGDDQNHRVGVSPNTYRLWVFRDSHAVRFDLIANDVVFSLYSNTSVPLNEWTHVSAVREGIMGYIYINGVLDASAGMTAGSVANSDPLTIGGIYDTLFDPPVQPLEGFGGLIDEVEIYNRALSASEIQEIFNAGSAGKCKNVTAPQLTALGPAKVWLGLKNSDDVGTKFDLLAEVLKNGSLVGSGQLNGVPGGSSGFNNAVLRTINLALSSPVSVVAGDTLSVRLSVRSAVGVSGHRSGTARLWFNDAAANSRFGATIGAATNDYFLLDGFALGTAAGAGAKKTIDVFVDRAAGGNPFKPFGTWSKTF